MIRMPPDLATRSKQGAVDTHAVLRPEDLEKLLLAESISIGPFHASVTPIIRDLNGENPEDCGAD